jgi:hypothetical protein
MSITTPTTETRPKGEIYCERHEDETITYEIFPDDDGTVQISYHYLVPGAALSLKEIPHGFRAPESVQFGPFSLKLVRDDQYSLVARYRLSATVN